MITGRATVNCDSSSSISTQLIIIFNIPVFLSYVTACASVQLKLANHKEDLPQLLLLFSATDKFTKGTHSDQVDLLYIV